MPNSVLWSTILSKPLFTKVERNDAGVSPVSEYKAVNNLRRRYPSEQTRIIQQLKPSALAYLS